MLHFKWKHFKQDVILFLVSWYLAYSPSYCEVGELAQERGMTVDHSSTHRWVSQLEEVFCKRHKPPSRGSLSMDETYIKLKGRWLYLYRAVDKVGNAVDFMLSEKRDDLEASAFFVKAIASSAILQTVTMDKSDAYKAGIETINLHLALLFMQGGLFL